jgi:hypothetical protein
MTAICYDLFVELLLRIEEDDHNQRVQARKLFNEYVRQESDPITGIPYRRGSS